MFLHLFLFLGLHEMIMRSDGIHVAPFLIIDQFSRPYWGDDDQDVNQSDVAKVKLALKLLDQFITTANEMGKGFQMIVFEHINPRYWEGLHNVHLVETFRTATLLSHSRPNKWPMDSQWLPAISRAERLRRIW